MFVLHKLIKNIGVEDNLFRQYKTPLSDKINYEKNNTNAYMDRNI